MRNKIKCNEGVKDCSSFECPIFNVTDIVVFHALLTRRAPSFGATFQPTEKSFILRLNLYKIY